MRALLDLMRDDESGVQTLAAGCAAVLQSATNILDILDPEVGEEELIQAVAAALAKVRMC